MFAAWHKSCIFQYSILLVIWLSDFIVKEDGSPLPPSSSLPLPPPPLPPSPPPPCLPFYIAIIIYFLSCYIYFIVIQELCSLAGRTGVLIACYLVFNNRMSANEAVHYVRSRRPNSVQTGPQVQCIQDFERFLKPYRLVFTVKWVDRSPPPSVWLVNVCYDWCSDRVVSAASFIVE